MKQLTKREKILIYILLCMIVFVGGLFMLVMPSFSAVTEAKTTNDTYHTQLKITQANAPDYSNAEKLLKQSEEKIIELRKLFYSVMQKEDVDNLITSFALERGLTPISLEISDLVEEEVLSYADYLSKISAETEGDAEAGTAENASTIKAKVYNITLIVNGTISNVQTLVNDANQTSSLKVASVQYAEQDSEEKQMTVTFKLYMIS